MTKLVMMLKVKQKNLEVSVGFPAEGAVHDTLKSVEVRLDNTIQKLHRESRVDSTLKFEVLAGYHRLSIDFGGAMPAGMLILPEQMISIISPLPLLVNDETAEPVENASIWHPDHPPVNLKALISSLFINNPQLTSFNRTFAGTSGLKRIPDDLFASHPNAKSFVGVFARSGLERLRGATFESNFLATDFSEAFMGCESLQEVPWDLFGCNAHAVCFDRTFAQSALKHIPPALFQNVGKHGSFVQTFARTQIEFVPQGLMFGVKPADIDGMVEPEVSQDDDPMNIKSSPLLLQDFFQDTLCAAGIPTRRTAS